MQLGMIGLGRMGANMVRRLMRGGHECVVFDLTADPRANQVQLQPSLGKPLSVAGVRSAVNEALASARA